MKLSIIVLSLAGFAAAVPVVSLSDVAAREEASGLDARGGGRGVKADSAIESRQWCVSVSATAPITAIA